MTVTSSVSKLWWCAYDDGAVWPCEPLDVNLFGVKVRALTPAPDAGAVDWYPPSRVYDSRGSRVQRTDILAVADTVKS